MKKSLMGIATMIATSTGLGVVTSNHALNNTKLNNSKHNEDGLTVNYKIQVKEESKPVDVNAWALIQVNEIKAEVQNQLAAGSFKNVLPYSVELDTSNVISALLEALNKDESTTLAFNYNFKIKINFETYKTIFAENKDLKINYEFISALHPVQKNLNDMIPHINEFLSKQRQIYFVKDSSKPQGIFAIKQADGKYTRIIPSDLKSYLWGVFQWSYDATSGSESWGWNVVTASQVNIPNLLASFNDNLIAARAWFADSEQTSAFSMNYFLNVKTNFEGQEINVSSTKTFYFNVYRA